MIAGIGLSIIGIVHLIKPDIFFKEGFFVKPEKFKKVQRVAATFVLVAGMYFIISAI